MTRRLALLLLAVATFAVACTGETPAPEATASGPAATATPVPAATPLPTATPNPTATPIPPTPTPAPTSTPAPPTPTPDTTPIVIQGDGWAITEADVARLAGFVEEIHETEFTAPVAVQADDDIGLTLGAGFEIFLEPQWQLLELLDLIDDGVDRDSVNEARRVRIRGVCCLQPDDGPLTVLVESLDSRLETEVVVVHELAHALHRQHEDRIGGPGRSGGFEQPSPYDSTFEAIAQFVAFEYLATRSAEEQAAVAPALPIVDEPLAAAAGRVPGEMLNFPYFTAPDLAAAVYAERGADGLWDLLERPPTTTEQVLFPETWLDNEDRVSQAQPVLPAGRTLESEGRLGVAILGWMLDDVADADTVDRLLVHWTGDRWASYPGDGGLCLAATVELDTDAAATELADLLAQRQGGDIAADGERRVRFDTCATTSGA